LSTTAKTLALCAAAAAQSASVLAVVLNSGRLLRALGEQR